MIDVLWCLAAALVAVPAFTAAAVMIEGVNARRTERRAAEDAAIARALWKWRAGP